MDGPAWFAAGDAIAERDFRRASRLTPVKALRSVRRVLCALLWIGVSVPVQTVFCLLPGRPKIWYARVFWSVAGRLIGLHVRVIGEIAKPPPGRAIAFVSNHSSWVDIVALGGLLEACFVAKNEVGQWPVIRRIARLGRTLFVSRRRGETIRERDEICARLTEGDNLILFPEGTTSDGCRVLDFRSTFFALANGEATPLIQPVSIVYDRLCGLPVGRRTRPLFAWYGDMDIASHFWRLARYHDYRATIALHEPVDPRDFPDRKALAAACWQVVAAECAVLRQNRTPHPGRVTLPAPAPAPAFA